MEWKRKYAVESKVRKILKSEGLS